MSFLTTVPVIAGKGLNIWLGLVLLGLITFQAVTGFSMNRKRGRLLPYHRFNAFLIIGTIIVHAYYGIGVWFFGFTYG